MGDEYVLGLDVHVDETAIVKMLDGRQQVDEELPDGRLRYIVMRFGVGAKARLAELDLNVQTVLLFPSTIELDQTGMGRQDLMLGDLFELSESVDFAFELLF